MSSLLVNKRFPAPEMRFNMECQLPEDVKWDEYKYFQPIRRSLPECMRSHGPPHLDNRYGIQGENVGVLKGCAYRTLWSNVRADVRPLHTVGWQFTWKYRGGITPESVSIELTRGILA